MGLSRSWKPIISQSHCAPGGAYIVYLVFLSGASQGAQMVTLCGNNRAIPITWKSRKLERVSKNPMPSETMALAQSADTGHFVALMTKEIANHWKNILRAQK